MKARNNKQLVRDFIGEVWNKMKLDKIPKFIDENYKVHTLGSKKTFRGIKFVETNISNCHKNFKNFKIKINDIVSEGDKVISRITLYGNNKTMKEFVIHKISRGKIIEAWSLGSNWD